MVNLREFGSELELLTCFNKIVALKLLNPKFPNHPIPHFSVSLTTEIGLNIHFIEGIKLVNFGNFKSKGKIYTDVQTYIEDNTFFTSIKLDYFYFIFLFAFLFPSSLLFLFLLASIRRSAASLAFSFLPCKRR